MTKLEAEKLLADAILLERALRVIERVYRRELLTDPTLHMVSSWLRYQAYAWRLEVERYDGS